MRRLLRCAITALASVVGLVGGTGCGVSNTRTVTAAAKAAAATSAAAPAGPILAGPWASHQEGYGHVEPQNVFNGGDPTGLIKHIEWLAWGGPRAVGVGSGYYVAANQIVAAGHREAAVIVAFTLGRCHGRPAYNAVQWYFPEHGEHFNPHAAGYKLCTGS